jgi:RNA-binding protein
MLDYRCYRSSSDFPVNRLNNQQKRYLKSIAHAKKPVVIVGANGLTGSVLDEIDLALDHHELIKVRINAGDRTERQAMVERINQHTGAQLVQRIGHIATLFRPNPEAPRLQLP